MKDIEIANKAQMLPIEEIAAMLGIDREHLFLYGKNKAKLPLSLIKPDDKLRSKLILVSAISPTPAGEGKTTTSIGLAQALNRLGKKTTVALREPSLGPVFGTKGGAAGGGYSQVLPMEDINLLFTGDFPAIEKAHNLLAAVIDNTIQSKNPLKKIDPRTVTWKRVMDVNDRALRKIVIGLGGTTMGVPRETGFDITAASEIMAILCLSSSLEDLKRRLGNIFVGYTYDKEPVFAHDLKVHGAMTVLLKEALMPNLVQTLENTPAILHGGPFANIAQGTNSILATKMAMSLSEYTVTEAGFGFELGGEKFLDIKCREAGISPNLVVLVATIRALKYHGGMKLSELKTPDINCLRQGLNNLAKHIENVKLFGLQPIVAINHFENDSKEEVEMIQSFCEVAGVPCALSEAWAKGGAGTEDLAREVIKIAEGKSTVYTPLYSLNASPEEKIDIIAKQLYGAEKVDYALTAKNQLNNIRALGLDKLPVCMAKTQKSLSDNPHLLGAPKGFVLNIREIEIASGAGFIIPLTGEMMRMPGLPERPSSELIDVDADGVVSGLF